jgi:uncharacterized membrane protein
LKNDSVRKLAMNGLMIALVFLATYFTRIPTFLPGGYFNLGDSIIMLAAAFLGPIGGLSAGGIGSAFADLAAGAFIFAPITLVVKGIEGLVVGLLAVNYMKSNLLKQAGGIRTLNSRTSNNQASNSNLTDKKQTKSPLNNLKLILALAVGAIIMVAGYFFGEAFILSLFDGVFGIVAATGELVANLVQGVLSAILAYILILILSRTYKLQK